MEKVFRFPLKMHVGAPAASIVKVGDEVERGQCIAEPEGLGARIHASVSGTVVEVTDREIGIEQKGEASTEFVKIKSCDKLADTVYEAGIVGAGGAGFPTHIKLQANIPDGYVIANCVECEPALHHNIKLLEDAPELVIKGMRYAMEATGAPKGYLALKAKNEKAIESITKALAGSDDIEIKALKDIYPMGEERAMINAIFGTWLEPTQLPLDANCVVLNGETLANITRAVEEGKPVIDKDVTIAGKINSDENYKILYSVPVGTKVKDLVAQVGGIDGEFGEIVIGGPYTGKAEDYETALVTKMSGGAIVTIEFPKFEGNMGLLVCACGADENRLRDIATKMGSTITGVTKCKNVVEVRGINKCLTPGDCPGQVQGIMYLKSQGAERVLISNCSDCSNTVMCCAPQMGLPVYHHTDHIFRTLDYPLTRRLPMNG